MPEERRVVARALCAKGFVQEQGSRDHDYFFLVYRGTKQAVFTKVSRGHNHRTLGDGLLGKMSRQLRLTNQEFRDLVACPLDHDEYISKLREQGIID